MMIANPNFIWFFFGTGLMSLVFIIIEWPVNGELLTDKMVKQSKRSLFMATLVLGLSALLGLYCYTL